jgi:hypothetical protein
MKITGSYEVGKIPPDHTTPDPMWQYPSGYKAVLPSIILNVEESGLFDVKKCLPHHIVSHLR